MSRLYLGFKDGSLGYLESVCHCPQCLERGMPEAFINDLDGMYMDCIKVDELEDAVIYIGESLADAYLEMKKYNKYKEAIRLAVAKFKLQPYPIENEADNKEK